MADSMHSSEYMHMKQEGDYLARGTRVTRKLQQHLIVLALDIDGCYLQIVVAPGPYVYLVLYRLVSCLVAARAMDSYRKRMINADFQKLSE